MFKVKSVEKLKSGVYCCEYYVYSNTSYELLNAVDLCDHDRIRVFLNEEDEDIMIPFYSGIYRLWEIPPLPKSYFHYYSFSFDDEKEKIEFYPGPFPDMPDQKPSLRVDTPDPHFDLEAFFKRKTDGKYIPEPLGEPIPERWQEPSLEYLIRPTSDDYFLEYLRNSHSFSCSDTDGDRHYSTKGDCSWVSYRASYAYYDEDDNNQMVNIIWAVLQNSTAPSSDGEFSAETYVADPNDRVDNPDLKYLDCEWRFHRHLSESEIAEYDSFFSSIFAKAHALFKERYL